MGTINPVIINQHEKLEQRRHYAVTFTVTSIIAPCKRCYCTRFGEPIRASNRYDCCFFNDLMSDGVR
ncbi:MAG: hypothetical protein R8M38_05175 [Mariprofundaceae bacterium]